MAVVPEVAKRLVAEGWELAVQAGAGNLASFPDAAYQQAGAQVVPDSQALYGGAQLVVRVQPVSVEEAAAVPEGAAVLSFLQPAAEIEALRVLAAKGATVFSFDLVPRLSRAQGMDALSSQSTVAGYRAALVAADHLGKFFPLLMTAAGTVPPARVLVMGVGVAGLQAIATARRLGAMVSAYDVRAAAKEEAESLGATFVDLGVSAEGAGGYARELSPDELVRQQQALAAVVAGSDAVVTTAAVPGRPAPVLVTKEMVQQMAPGSVIVDMAVDQGGNCEVSLPGQDVVVSGTTVVGLANPAADLPIHASFLYARNVAHFLGLVGPGGHLVVDLDDEVVAGACVLEAGRPVHEPTAELLGATP